MALILIELPSPNFYSSAIPNMLSRDLKWGQHVDKIHAKTFKRLYFLTCLKRAGVEENELLDYYRSIIRSVVEYAFPAWSTGITEG